MFRASLRLSRIKKFIAVILPPRGSPGVRHRAAGGSAPPPRETSVRCFWPDFSPPDRFTGKFCFAVLICLLITGCGGGGGGGGNGTGVDPVEIEVGVAMDVFLKAVAERNLTGAMGQVDSNLQYRRSGLTGPLGYNNFQGYLSAFIASASSITIELQNRGITPGETAAVVRGSLVYSYLDSSGVRRSPPAENCEVGFERSTKWGINLISGFDLAGLAFPPAP